MVIIRKVTTKGQLSSQIYEERCEPRLIGRIMANNRKVDFITNITNAGDYSSNCVNNCVNNAHRLSGKALCINDLSAGVALPHGVHAMALDSVLPLLLHSNGLIMREKKVLGTFFGNKSDSDLPGLEFRFPKRRTGVLNIRATLTSFACRPCFSSASVWL